MLPDTDNVCRARDRAHILHCSFSGPDVIGCMGQNNSQRTFKDEYERGVASTRIIVRDPGRIDEELENNRIDTALLLTATTAEAILRKKLTQYFEIHPLAFDEVCGDKTLGWYVGKCNEKEIIDKPYRDSFDSLVKKRNKLVHNLGYMDELLQEDEEMEEVRDIIEDCSEWFNSLRQNS